MATVEQVRAFAKGGSARTPLRAQTAARISAPRRYFQDGRRRGRPLARLRRSALTATEAIKQDAQGAYYVEFSECNLCEACVPECPEGVMFVRAELANTAWKCTACGDCVAVCGTSALWLAEKEAVAG